MQCLPVFLYLGFSEPSTGVIREANKLVKLYQSKATFVFINTYLYTEI